MSPARLRPSTVALIVFFLVVLTVYVLVRPPPAPVAPAGTPLVTETSGPHATRTTSSARATPRTTTPRSRTPRPTTAAPSPSVTGTGAPTTASASPVPSSGASSP